jgi:hypothetical protein
MTEQKLAHEECDRALGGTYRAGEHRDVASLGIRPRQQEGKGDPKHNRRARCGEWR